VQIISTIVPFLSSGTRPLSRRRRSELAAPWADVADGRQAEIATARRGTRAQRGRLTAAKDFFAPRLREDVIWAAMFEAVQVVLAPDVVLTSVRTFLVSPRLVFVRTWLISGGENVSDRESALSGDWLWFVERDGAIIVIASIVHICIVMSRNGAEGGRSSGSGTRCK
jgi:hypothetical protein